MVAITSLIFSCGVHNLKLSYVGLGTINFITISLLQLFLCVVGRGIMGIEPRAVLIHVPCCRFCAGECHSEERARGPNRPAASQ